METFEKLDSYLDKFLCNDKLTQDVYHYTDSYEKMISILRRRCLILSMHARIPSEINDELEDDAEISHSISILKRHQLWNEQLAFPPFNKQLALRTVGESFEYYTKQIRFFTASFSLNRDNRELWKLKHFEKRDQRFSIRICKDHFNSAFEENGVKYIWDRCKPFNGVVKICYGEDAIFDIAELVLRILRHPESQENSKKYWEIIQIVFSKLIPILPKSLHSCYESEGEYRIYTQDIGIGTLEELRIADEVIFQGEGGCLSLYSDQISLQHILEVLVWGEETRYEETRAQIQNDLKEHFPKEMLENLKITKSAVPYEQSFYR